MPGAPRKKSAPRRAAPRRPATKATKTTKTPKTGARASGSPAKQAVKKVTKKPVKKVVKKPAKAAKKATKPAKVSKVKKPAKASAPKRPAKAAAKATAVAKPAKAPKPPVFTKVPAARLPGAAGAASAPVKAVAGRKRTVICELSGFEVTPSAPTLSPKTLERLREKLVDEKQRLLHQAEELAAEAEQLAAEREAGDTQFDEESGEGDTVNVERERDLLLSATARQVVEEIDEALARIKKGTYGVCKYAGRKLPLERLEAIPWANVCVDCKARAERRR